IENLTPFEKCVSLVDLFGRAGYESFWLSNQSPLGEYDTPNAVISASADHTYFTASENSINSSIATSGNHFDEKLIQAFEKYSGKFNKSKKQVFFIHLMGSHWSYSDRYPKRFNIFNSQRNNDPASYLNSVRYNDLVVSSLIKRAQNKDFDLVTYFSDHGEDMEFQHNQGNYRKSMSTIPLLVYLSESYMQKNPGLKQRMISDKDTPAMTDNFFHDIQILSGLNSSLFEPENSFVSDTYRRRKRRVIGGTTAFD
ncbi:MAG: phosphoethanolamine transferase, partial [Bacteroidetes bacterium]|nr:phosphoethanolamine transferase [Bacteroidota bacterium]